MNILALLIYLNLVFDYRKNLDVSFSNIKQKNESQIKKSNYFRMIFDDDSTYLVVLTIHRYLSKPIKFQIKHTYVSLLNKI